MIYPNIENWSILSGSLVHGRIFGHEDIADETYITTPKIVDVYGGGFYTIVIAKTGHIYKLGQISEEYKAWTVKQGLYDPLNLVKVTTN